MGKMAPRELVSAVAFGAPPQPPLEPGSAEWILHEPAVAIDDKDKGTPDEWVPRNPSILRLTGRHPLNCEPPMEDLMRTGFITPVSLHIVRNHGAVPKLDWSSHVVEVNGLVEMPVTLTMDDIYNGFPHVTIPVTVTCAGNRRKEENSIKKSIGFNWGHTATSCSYWTGVRLSDVLKSVKIKEGEESGKFVCFRGPEGELPKGDDGSYGTSLKISYAMDPANDVLLAFKQNGRWLTPDHGFPVRMIIPGFIGGRMVKWLSEITVTENESSNHYHYNDNRVLPPHVDEAIAKEEGWWYKPDFIINELNINSAVARPRHDELVSLKKNQAYTLRGYAYSGGGRKIIRVEVSIDDGGSWTQADLYRGEAPTQYNKYWCWVHWSLETTVESLATAQEILLRAWDESQNGQPREITWNVMGMMNNCYFKILVSKQVSQNGEICLKFQHPAPTEIGALGNVGWREEEKLKINSQTKKQLKKPIATQENQIKISEKPLMNRFEEMTLDSSPVSILLNQDNFSGAQIQEIPIALNPRKKILFSLIEKIELSRNVRLFRFALQSPSHKLGLPVGQHMFLYASVGGEMIMRAYTPTSCDDDLGHFDLVVKIYRANEHPRFPQGGKMSQYLDEMQMGDTIEVKGPVGHLSYIGCGNFLKNKKPFNVSKVAMIAGGTGITPMYQVIREILKNPLDKTQITLLFANQTEEDILLREELEDWESKHSNFRIWYTLDIIPDKWPYSSGFITEDMMKDHLCSSGPDGVVLLCGPKPMIDFACKPGLERLGWEKHQMIEF